MEVSKCGDNGDKNSNKEGDGIETKTRVIELYLYICE
jgi:hypothetical protein